MYTVHKQRGHNDEASSHVQAGHVAQASEVHDEVTAARRLPRRTREIESDSR